MQFKQYRMRGVVEAAVIERDMTLPDGTQVNKGDYIRLTDGKAEYVAKDDFDAQYEPYRQRATTKQPATKNGSKSKAKAKTAPATTAAEL